MRMFFFAVIPLGVEVDGLLDFSEGGLDPCFSFLGFQVLAPEEALDDDMEIDLFLDLDFEGDLEIEDLDLSRFLGNRFTQRLWGPPSVVTLLLLDLVLYLDLHSDESESSPEDDDEEDDEEGDLGDLRIFRIIFRPLGC